MTITKSDDFTGLSAGGAVNGRSLNHGLGGSGSETWTANGSCVGATGGGKVAPTGTQFGFTFNANGKARVKFNYSASTNLRICARSSSVSGGNSSFAVALIGTSSLRIRQFDASDGSLGDVATGSISAISTGTDYYLECECNGTNIVGRVFESDGTTQRGSSVTYAAAPTGQYWVVNEYFGGGTVTVDDFTMDDLAGGGSPEIVVSGNSVTIADGDATPSATDHTDFGSVVQGGSALSRTFTVQNTGTADLTTSGLSVPSGYTVTEGLSATIAASASDTFTVELGTSTVGVFAGDISFTNNDSDEGTFNFAVTGEITAPPPPPPPPAGSSFTGNILVPVWGVVRSPIIGV